MMKTLQYSLDITTLNEDTKRIDYTTIEAGFCINARDMTVGLFSDLETYTYNLPMWAKVVLGFKKIEAIDPILIEDDMYISKWPKDKYSEFAHILIDLLRFFCISGDDALDYLQQQRFEMYADVSELNDLFCNVFNAFYESHAPEEIEHFEHKGRRFIVPYDPVIIGAALTWGEATEALQSDYFTKPAEGKYGAGLLLNNSLTIIAALCREVKVIDKKRGTFAEVADIPNMQEDAWAAHLASQKAFFADLPCSVSRDVGFFLSSSFVRLETTASLVLLLKSPLWLEIAAAMRH